MKPRRLTREWHALGSFKNPNPVAQGHSIRNVDLLEKVVSKPTTEELKHELADFYGSESFYRHTLNRKVTYTEGVQRFAERAGAYWLLDIIATEPKILAQAKEFAAISLTVTGSKAILRVTDGNDNQAFKRMIEFTDCPAGTWEFFFTNGVIMLPSEY